MHLPENFQFRLIGIGVYQLAALQEEAQLCLCFKTPLLCKFCTEE